jgi:hypothetical protein
MLHYKRIHGPLCNEAASEFVEAAEAFSEVVIG